MKQKYEEGDIFAIPLENKKYSICQIVWAPKSDYQRIFSFCVLENGNSQPTLDTGADSPIPLKDNTKTVEVIFSGVKYLASGQWRIIGHKNLSESSKNLQVFNIAGSLHEGDAFIRKLTPDEYVNYPAMSVFGFELIQKTLISNI